MASLAILITGDPIPTVRELIPSFGILIRDIACDINVDWFEIDLRTSETLPDPHEFAACIITGSPHSVTEQTPWIRQAEAYVRRTHAAGIGLFGICFGHQLMASAFGGQVSINSQGREMGLSVARCLSANNQLRLPGGSIEVLMSHRDTVSMLPMNARVLAETARDEHAAIHYGGGSFSTQFHPEFSPRVLSCYLEHYRQQLQSQGDDVDQLIANIRETPDARALLRHFIDAQLDRHQRHSHRCAS